MLLDERHREVLNAVQRALSRAVDFTGQPALSGPFQNLTAVLDRNFRHILQPPNPAQLGLVHQGLRAVQHDVIALCTIATRLKWLQEQLASARGTDREQVVETFVQISSESDIGSFHRLLVSASDHAARSVFNTLDQAVVAPSFPSLEDAVNSGGAPVGVGYPLGEVILNFAPVARGAREICHLIETMGAQEYCLIGDNGTVSFQLLDWDNNEIITTDRVSVGMPTLIVRNGWINVDAYFGALLGCLLSFLSELTTHLYTILKDEGRICPSATFDLADPDTIEVLVNEGLDRENLRRMLRGLTGTVTIDRTIISSQYIASLTGAIECMRDAVSVLSS